ncbi:MAG: hypothetical protein ACRD2E_13510 [Terriglobales bacterium]
MAAAVLALPLWAQAPAAQVPAMRYRVQRLGHGVTVIVSSNRAGNAAAPVAAVALWTGPPRGPAARRSVGTVPAAALAATLAADAAQARGSERVVVAIAGAVRATPTLALAARLFSPAEAAPAGTAGAGDPPVGLAEAVASPGATAAAPATPLVLTITWPGPAANAKDTAALAMLGEGLFGGPDARERRSLVSKWRAALAVAGGLDGADAWGGYQAPGRFLAQVLFRPAVSPTLVRELVFRQIHEIEVNGIPLEQLRRTEIWTAADWLRRGQTAAARARRLARAVWRTGSAAAANQALAPMLAVTVAEMQAAAARYLSDALGQLRVRPGGAWGWGPGAGGGGGVEGGTGYRLPGSRADRRAEQGRSGASVPASLPAWQPPAPDVATQYPNGLRLIVIHDANTPLVTARLSVPAPPPGQAPLARALAQLLLAGTADRSGSALAQQFEGLGGDVWARAGERRFIIGASALAAYVGPMLRRLAAVVIRPAIPPAALAIQQLNAPTWRAWREADPQWLARQEAARLAAPAPAQAAMATSRQNLLAFARKLLLPNNDAQLVIVGDVDPNWARSLAAQYFVDPWPFGYPSAHPAHPPLSAGGRLLLVNTPGAEAAWAFVPTTPPPAPGSALYGAWILARWLAAAPDRPAATAATPALLRTALERRAALSTAPLSTAQLAVAKSGFMAQLMGRWQTQAQIAAAWTYGDPGAQVAAAAAASAAQVQAAARQYLGPPLVVVAGNAAALKVPLSHLARGAITILNAQGAMIGAYPPEGPARRSRRRIPH